MNFLQQNVLNFTNLVLEYSDRFNFTPAEIVTVLMIKHISDISNEVITADLLTDKLHLPKAEVDKILVNLYTKKYIDYDITGDNARVSLEPLQILLYEEFEKALAAQKLANQNSNEIAAKQKIYEALEDLLQRSLTNLEAVRVDDWLSSTDDPNVILNSIKDAKNKKLKSISSVEKIFISKLRDMDNQGNEIERTK